MAFRRKDGNRWRYFFVQFDSQIPVYTFKKKGQQRELWRNAKAEAYFDTSRGQMIRKPGAIYDIVLTDPIDLDDCTVTSISHPWCASDKGAPHQPPKKPWSQSLAAQRAASFGGPLNCRHASGDFHVWMAKRSN
jgi:hypothetical protein